MKNVPFQTKIFGLVLAFLPLLVVLGGCETTAGPAEAGIARFHDTILGEGRVEVELKGHGTMPQSMATQLLFLHAAELAQKDGYRYFTLHNITGRVIAEEAQRRASAARILGQTRDIASDTGEAEVFGGIPPDALPIADPPEFGDETQDSGVGAGGRRGPEGRIQRPIYDPDRPRLVVVAGFFRDRPPADRHYFEARIPIERLRAEYGL